MTSKIFDSLRRFLRISAKTGDGPPQAEPPQASGTGLIRPEDAHDSRAGTPEWVDGQLLLGLYEVRGLLGEGGMGKVFKVFHRGWGIELALKRPRPELFASEAGRAGFIREAETWVSLGLYPHIASCYYVRTLDETPLLFAELVEGGSLKEWIDGGMLYAGGERRARERILDLSLQFAWGVGFAHAQGLIHQDIKPANVLLSADGLLKITDFGLARARSAASSVADGATPLVSSGGMTPAYCSPEQARRDPLTAHTDIWSFGVSVLEMFTGRVTWTSGQTAGLALEACLARPADHTRLRMPDGVADCVRRCLASNVDDRPASMAQVAELLLDAYHAETGRPYPRIEPSPLDFEADSLSNRAVSLYDLGKRSEAEALLDAWLARDPHALYPWVNRRAIALNAGQETPQDVAVAFDRLIDEYHPGAPASDEEIEGYQRRFRRHGIRHQESVTGLALTRDGKWLAMLTVDRRARLFDLEQGVIVREFDAGSTEFQGTTANAFGWTAWARRPTTPLALSEDGARLFVAAGATISVFDCQTGETVKTIRVLLPEVNYRSVGRDPPRSMDPRQNRLVQPQVECLAVGPGELLFVGSVQGIALLLDARTGFVVHSLEGHQGGLQCGIFSRDGRSLYTTSKMMGEPAIFCWDVETGRRERFLALPGENGYVLGLALSDDGRMLAACSHWSLYFLSLPSGEILKKCAAHGGSFLSVALSSDGRICLTGSEAEENPAETNGAAGSGARLWDVGRGVPIRDFSDSAARITFVGLSGDGSLAILAGSDGAVQVSRTADDRTTWPTLLRKSLSIHERLERASARAQALTALAGGDTAAYTTLEALRARTPEYRRDSSLSAAISAACRGFAVPTEISDCWQTRVLKADFPVRAVALSPGADLALLGGRGGNTALFRTDGILIHRLATGNVEGTDPSAGPPPGSLDALFPDSEETPVGVCFSGDGTRAFASAGDGKVAVFDVASGALLATLDGDYPVAVHPDGAWLLSVLDSRLELREIADGSVIRRFDDSYPTMWATISQALSPDGALAAGCFQKEDAYKGGVRLFDLETGESVGTVNGDTGCAAAVAFGAERRLIAAATAYRVVLLWDADEGHLLQTLSGHRGRVNGVAFDPGGRFVFTGSNDGTIKIWESHSGRLLRTLSSKKPTALALSLDGQFLLSGGLDGSATLFTIDRHYSFMEELLDGAEAVFFGGADDSRYWRHLEGAADAYAGLLYDLSRAATRPNLPTRVLERHERLKGQIAACVARELVTAREADRAFMRGLERLATIDPVLYWRIVSNPVDDLAMVRGSSPADHDELDELDAEAWARRLGRPRDPLGELVAELGQAAAPVLAGLHGADDLFTPMQRRQIRRFIVDHADDDPLRELLARVAVLVASPRDLVRVRDALARVHAISEAGPRVCRLCSRPNAHHYRFCLGCGGRM